MSDTRTASESIKDGNKPYQPAKAKVVTGPDSLKGRVLTPGGYRLIEHVHRVEKNHLIRYGKDKTVITDMESKAVIKEIDPEPETPVRPSTGDGWQTFAYWWDQTNSPISWLKTTWEVPAPPATVNPSLAQTIFIFNAFENATNNDILQPVLQWGLSGAGGGQYWAIANWYIDPAGHAYFSELVKVEPGTAIQGVMSMVDTIPGSMTYSTTFTGYLETTVNTGTTGEFVVATETLECYSISQCTDYPAGGGTLMYDIELGTLDSGVIQVPWTADTLLQQCSLATTFPEADEVLLSY